MQVEISSFIGEGGKTWSGRFCFCW